MDCLLKENAELRAKAEEGDALRKEVGELKNRIKAMEKEVKTARAERDKSKEVVWEHENKVLIRVVGKYVK